METGILNSKTEAYAGRDVSPRKSSNIILFWGTTRHLLSLGCGRKIPGCLRTVNALLFFGGKTLTKKALALDIYQDTSLLVVTNAMYIMQALESSTSNMFHMSIPGFWIHNQDTLHM